VQKRTLGGMNANPGKKAKDGLERMLITEPRRESPETNAKTCLLSPQTLAGGVQKRKK